MSETTLFATTECQSSSTNKGLNISVTHLKTNLMIDQIKQTLNV